MALSPKGSVIAAACVPAMGKGGGCSRCCECGGKFEAYSAEDYAEDQGEEPDYDTCPDCLASRVDAAAKDSELERLREENTRLKKSGAAAAEQPRDDSELEQLRKENENLKKSGVAAAEQLRDENAKLRSSAAASTIHWALAPVTPEAGSAPYLLAADRPTVVGRGSAGASSQSDSEPADPHQPLKIVVNATGKDGVSRTHVALVLSEDNQRLTVTGKSNNLTKVVKPASGASAEPAPLGFKLGEHELQHGDLLQLDGFRDEPRFIFRVQQLQSQPMIAAAAVDRRASHPGDPPTELAALTKAQIKIDQLEEDLAKLAAEKDDLVRQLSRATQPPVVNKESSKSAAAAADGVGRTQQQAGAAGAIDLTAESSDDDEPTQSAPAAAAAAMAPPHPSPAKRKATAELSPESSRLAKQQAPRRQEQPNPAAAAAARPVGEAARVVSAGLVADLFDTYDPKTLVASAAEAAPGAADTDEILEHLGSFAETLARETAAAQAAAAAARVARANAAAKARATRLDAEVACRICERKATDGDVGELESCKCLMAPTSVAGQAQGLRACVACRDALDEPHSCESCDAFLCQDCEQTKCEGCQVLRCGDCSPDYMQTCTCGSELCETCAEGNWTKCLSCEALLCDDCERSVSCDECGGVLCQDCGTMGKTPCEMVNLCESCSEDYDCVDCDRCAGYY